jgi:hypothetical protein
MGSDANISSVRRKHGRQRRALGNHEVVELLVSVRQFEYRMGLVKVEWMVYHPTEKCDVLTYPL